MHAIVSAYNWECELARFKIICSRKLACLDSHRAIQSILRQRGLDLLDCVIHVGPPQLDVGADPLVSGA